MRKNWVKKSLLVLFLAASSTSWAEVVEDLYGASVPVPDVSEEALTVASREALSEVFVKVSGGEQVLLAPAITAALDRSRSLVQRFAYARADDADATLSAHFEFEASSISGLLAQAGQPFWTANRPAVLSWVVVEGPRGRQFLSGEALPDFMASFNDEFARRGVPVQMPLYDIDDAAAMDPDTLWSQRTVPLRDASQRYGGEHILAGRVAILSSGDWVGDWAYLSHNSRVDRTVRVDSGKRFFEQGSALVAQQMSARYAVVSSVDVSNAARLKISGIASYRDYASIVAWLESLELIDAANISAVRGDIIYLDLAARAPAQSLTAIIELNSRLAALPVSGQNGELSYQWLN